MSQRSSSSFLLPSEASRLSSASISSSSFVNAEGAGSSSSAIAISTTGKVSSSSDSVFTPGATSSKGSASASVSLETVITSAKAEAPIAGDPPPTTPIAPISSLATSSPNASTNEQGVDSLASPSADVKAPGFEQTNLIEPIFSTPSSAVSINQRLAGNLENNRIRGSQKNDLILGRSGDDVLRGRGGDDWLNGGEGDDLLHGGSGCDVMIGAGGADTFVLHDSVTVPSRVDVILDFKAAQGDKFKLAKGLSLNEIQLEVVDFDRNGSVDATLIRVNKNSEILAVTLNTVSASGQTVLQATDFI